MSVNTSVVNVVATSTVDREFDLNELAEDLDQTSYNPEDFPGLVYRIDGEPFSSLIFHTGKIVSTGANDIDEAESSLHRVIDDLREIGVEIDDDQYSTEIVNVVSNVDLDEDVNLNAAAIALGLENVEYEPEQFPGLIYRLDDPDSCVLVFGTGEAVVCGSTTYEDADRALTFVKEELESLGLIGDQSVTMA